MRRWVLPLLLVALLLAPGLAAAQANSPVLVKRVDERGLAADAETPAVAEFSLYNLNPRAEFFVSVEVTGPRRWNAEVQGQSEFLLAPRNGSAQEPRETTIVRVAFSPVATPQEEAVFEVAFKFFNTETAAAYQVVEEVRVGSLAPPLILDWFPNRLPAPLDNAYGTFLVDMLFWIGIGLVAIFVGDAIVRVITARASSATTREILHMLRRPVFLFIFFLGLARSFAILPRNPATILISKILTAIGVVFFGLYVMYRILDAGLLYYHRTWAVRTQTKLDDILIPLLRKVGIVVLYVVGAVVVLRNLGWDPTVVLAGASIAGLVIAFAAQDTFSNLFSGVFILLDRPFKEGDDIQLETGEFVRVENIGLRTTRLYHPRNHEVITLPNNQLATRRVVNLTGPDVRYWVAIDVGTAYASDPSHVRNVLLETVRAHPRAAIDADWQPLVLFTGFGDSSLLFTVRVPVKDYRERGIVGSELRFAILEAFNREGIEIPFPQRTLWIRQADTPDADAAAEAGR